MKFSDLNNKRKLVVQELVSYFPSIKDRGSITLKELKMWWADFENTPERKIGYPMWLVTGKEFRGSSRGEYLVPVPGKDDALAYTDKKMKLKTLGELTDKPKSVRIMTGIPTVYESGITEEEFLEICKEAGINV